MPFAWTKTEKLRRSRIVRESMAQYQRMQRDDLRELFPDWFAMEADALDRAKTALDTIIAEHNREHDRRVARAETARKEGRHQ